MKLKDYLISIDACNESIEWVRDRTIEQAIADCHRGDWMLFIAKKLNIEKRKLVLTAGHCANTVRHLMTDKRSTYAVDAAIAYGEGRITEDELKAAARAASAAYAAYAAYDAYAAAYYAAAAAAYYAAADAAYANGVAEITANQLQTADICRDILGQMIIDKVNEIIQ